MYVTADDVRAFCGLTEEECSDEAAEAAIAYAQGVIDTYCGTRFEVPAEASVYLYDGDGSTTIFAPQDGPWGAAQKIEYYDGSSWVEYDGDYWIKGAGEWLELEDELTEGNQNWRVTAKCWTPLDAGRTAMLRRATLMLCRLALVPRDEPLGPSVRAVSYEGVSYSYQPVDQGHPTGMSEIDHILRTLRRSVIRP